MSQTDEAIRRAITTSPHGYGGTLQIGISADGTATLTNKNLVDNSVFWQDDADSTKKVEFELAGLTTGNTRTLTVQDSNGTIALTSDIPTDYVDLTSAQTITGTKTVNKLRINDTVGDHYYNLVASVDLAGNYDLNLPQILTNDVLITELSTSTLTNKTLAGNTVYKSQDDSANNSMPPNGVDDQIVLKNYAQSLKNKTVSDALLIGATDAPQSSSVLELRSTTKGLLPPRMTTIQKLSIVSPVAGMVVFDTDLQTLQVYDGLIWDFPSRPRYGSINISTPVATIILAVSTWTKISGFTDSILLSEDVTMPADNQIFYSGVSTRVFKVDCMLSVAINNKNLSYAIFKDGVICVGSTVSAYSLNNKDNIVSILCLIEMSTGSYIEIFIRNDDDATDPTINNMTVCMTSI